MEGINRPPSRRTRTARGFADVTYDEALSRAEALIPFLREQAPKCEALRKLTPEVMQALHEKGCSAISSKMWGGMECRL